MLLCISECTSFIVVDLLQTLVLKTKPVLSCLNFLVYTDFCTRKHCPVIKLFCTPPTKSLTLLQSCASQHSTSMLVLLIPRHSCDLFTCSGQEFWSVQLRTSSNDHQHRQSLFKAQQIRGSHIPSPFWKLLICVEWFIFMRVVKHILF